MVPHFFPRTPLPGWDVSMAGVHMMSHGARALSTPKLTHWRRLGQVSCPGGAWWLFPSCKDTH